ncbi:UDP-N-acetylmuramoyl-tripeptide--D-alanyl-D-alanine ligase [Weissella diestrammenae]|uniref:UDP-N-acetylmuramoyl-tripeptide--D-alanyl-D-alanine ligase n=1 Tax=Weissella diestrammenae TaxID=1162633 RepID=A0A7G9T6J3_9LACO|nr:UDP-N-acetylmuramoyl-tripeptide--D-alanyl-D-alanine ligase [Weissella diestrammenae]MCM0583226.1 UDP-N-acetylmuramoyl-tripeptide--D-alanyl-D-alanine ligase [Weissella diestrammenae]QNN75718.1 UDP-N-acetylmuramoyl-tripeptide--D-alanyl-D-alanine ligase [Weissella diestrammenae]
MNYSIQQIAKIVGGTLINNQDTEITKVVFDGRQATQNTLFVPITWGNDGHNYINGAIDNGASATFWSKDHPNPPQNFPTILVDDTLKAFQQLAVHYLRLVGPQVVAISGSNGKTTTKDFIAAIGAKKYRTVKTPANFNNEIGVPTTILKMPQDTELLVIELGMDHPGDLDLLSKMITPDIAVLTMIGEAHIEFFKTRERIADGKMEIINGLKPDGTLVYNGDEPLLITRSNANPTLKTNTFGLHAENQLFASEISLMTTSANFTTNQSTTRFTIPLTGNYNVSNALAAISVGHLLAIDDAQIAEALKHTIITSNRTEWLSANFGGQILSDVYNANPTAMAAVLTSFQATPTTGQRFLVLGDMLELGDVAPKMHADLAEAIDPSKIDGIYLVGDLMMCLEKRLKEIAPTLDIHHYPVDQKSALMHDLQLRLKPNDLMLVKGSHGIHLETVVAAFVSSTM